MNRATSLLTEIHDRRQICGKKRQPKYTTILTRLNDVLNSELNAEHPYALSDTQLESLNQRTNVFSFGGGGPRGKPVGNDYLYRIVKKGHLQYFVKLKWSGYRNNASRMWKSIMTKSQRGRLWLRLEDFADQNYPAGIVNRWFNSTWWTDFPLDQDVILGAHTVGMFSNWITDEVYVLRVLVRSLVPLDVARVPTAVEAFLQPVFRPTEQDSSQAGITINLCTYKKPVDGVPEFCVRPFEVKHIDLKPVQLDVAARQRHQEISQWDPDVLQSLVNFYNTL